MDEAPCSPIEQQGVHEQLFHRQTPAHKKRGSVISGDGVMNIGSPATHHTVPTSEGHASAAHI